MTASFDVPARLIRRVWPPNDYFTPGNNERFDTMLDSVRAEGIRDPLTINVAWELIDGHHRLASALLLGLPTVPVRVWTGTEFVP